MGEKQSPTFIHNFNIVATMEITFSEDFIRLIGFDKYADLKAGKASLSIGSKDIILYEDNKSKVSVIKDGTIKSIV